MNDKDIEIAGQPIGNHNLPLFLPDIGTFFNQDMTIAYQLINELAACEVSVVKGEILHDADICLMNSGVERYWGHQKKQFIEEPYRRLIERKVVPLASYEKLFTRCKVVGMNFVVSVYDSTGADFAKDIGAAALKIASSNITHAPLIEHVSKLDLPLIVDTGHATFEEIARAINWAQDAGARRLVIEHSPLPPPNPVSTQNLRFMVTLGSALGLPYGLSDHHAGEEMLYAATAMGASVVEKGVCPDAVCEDQDVAHALPVKHIKEVFDKIKSIHLALGSGVRYLPRIREKYVSRMGLVAKRDLSPGATIDLKNVTFAFPALGIGTEYWSQVHGWTLTIPRRRGEIIGWKHVGHLVT